MFTSEGEILFVDAQGDLLKERTVAVPHLDIKREWWNRTAGQRQDWIGQFVRTSPPGLVGCLNETSDFHVPANSWLCIAAVWLCSSHA